MFEQEQSIIVDFDQSGNIVVEVDGVQGSGCEALTEDLISQIGGVIKTEYKDSYYEADPMVKGASKQGMTF